MKRITYQAIDLSGFLGIKPPHSAGATATFVGTVRNTHEGKKVLKLRYECYEAMAEKQLETICERARSEFNVDEVHVIHRCGELLVGEAAVAIVIHSGHRNEAFRACRFVIDEIKCSVPIWKHEYYEDGSSEWVVCNHGENAF